MPRYKNDPRIITLRLPEICSETGRQMKANEQVLYYPLTGGMYGLDSKAYCRYLSDLQDMFLEDTLSF